MDQLHSLDQAQVGRQDYFGNDLGAHFRVAELQVLANRLIPDVAVDLAGSHDELVERLLVGFPGAHQNRNIQQRFFEDFGCFFLRQKLLDGSCILGARQDPHKLNQALDFWVEGFRPQVAMDRQEVHGASQGFVTHLSQLQDIRGEASIRALHCDLHKYNVRISIKTIGDLEAVDPIAREPKYLD